MTPPDDAAVPFELAGQAVMPGTRERLHLPIARLPTGTPITLPVEVLVGARHGPVVWLSGALHGDEIVGVEIILRILEQLDPRRIAGVLLAVPIVNVYGFLNESRYLPDRRDLNRVFPGSATGSMASHLAHVFMDGVVRRCSAGIDFHAGSNDRTNLPQIRANLDDPDTLAMARAFGAPVNIHGTEIKGSLRRAATREDRRVLLFEGGEPRRFSEDAVKVGVPGALRVLHHLGMLSDAPDGAGSPWVESRRTRWIRAPRSGILWLDVDLGDEVRRGQRVGHVTDPGGTVGPPIHASLDGLVVGRTVNPVVHRGAAILHVAG